MNLESINQPWFLRLSASTGANMGLASDHATLAFALAFGLICGDCLPTVSCALAAAAVAVSWSRVYVAVHFPFGMLGPRLISAGARSAHGLRADSSMNNRSRGSYPRRMRQYAAEKGCPEGCFDPDQCRPGDFA